MHYYQHRIGDHAAKASNLPLMEEGVLRRLYDIYFETEQPLPNDLARLCRRVGARTKAEREAVERLLSEFFVLDGQVWRHAAFDEQIADYQDDEPNRQARKENERLRKQRYREDRAKMFEELRLLGTVLPWNTSTEELRRQLDLSRDLSRGTRRGQDGDGTATQEPVTNNQQPRTNTQEQQQQQEQQQEEEAEEEVVDDVVDANNQSSSTPPSISETNGPKSVAPPPHVAGGKVGGDMYNTSSLDPSTPLQPQPEASVELPPAIVQAIHNTRSIELLGLLSNAKFAQLTEADQRRYINRWRRKNDPAFGQGMAA